MYSDIFSSFFLKIWNNLLIIILFQKCECFSRRNIEKKIEMAEEEKLIMCKICDKIFSRNDHLKRHEMTHTGEKPFECDVCFKEFSTNYHLKRHSILHSGKANLFTCKLCGKSFAEEYRLNRHQFLHLELKLFKCHICEKSFARNESLRRHILSHKSAQCYKCKICEFSFPSDKDLKTHFLSHLDPAIYECNICNKTFSKNEELKVHKEIHLGPKPFKCDICHIGVSRRSHLRRHKLKIHGGIDSNTCDDLLLSDSSLSEKSDLNHESEASTSRHNSLKIIKDEPMEEDLSYSCNICDKTFTLKFSYDRHMKIKHQDRNRNKSSEVYHYDEDLVYLDSDIRNVYLNS